MDAEGRTAEAESGSTVTPFRPALELEDKASALSATLLAELEAHWTAGLQAALAWPELALRVMVHALATDALYSRYGETVVVLHTYPLPSPLPAPALPTARRGRPCARPRTYGAPGCPVSTEHSGHGCRTRTCRPC